ncbi:MAG: DICT sensory domain-containing protein [Leptolyngbyaceae cyanobacterium bins.349]|nr:DICT sensory domain-containing protein [Leptolyngbyaceae cyanobacterium bins.349]
MLEGSILHQLKMAHQPGQVGKRPLNFGVYYKNTLVSLCHALEDCILECQSQPLVITAFQRGKWYLQEADRYADLAQRSQQVVIMAAPDAGFAEHPTSQRDNVHLISLNPDDPVAQEWHLMILAPTYAAMVLCQELLAEDYGPQGLPTQDLERKFYGFWTFEANLVQETMELAIAHLQPYDPALAAQLTDQMCQLATARAATHEQDPLGAIVARVVDYLQHSQIDMSDQAHSMPAHSMPAQSMPTHSTPAHTANLDVNLVSNEVQAFLRMAQLTDQADQANPNAAAEVAALAEAIGQLLNLPVWQLNRLKLAGLLHRLAPLQQSHTVLSSGTFGRYSEEMETAAPSCPLIPGAQVLRTMPQLRAIATIITHQTEAWDGTGQPGGLAGDEIPLESRILGLMVEFQQHLAQARQTLPHSPESHATQAFAACQKDQNRRWDPKLVDTLALLVGGFQQGLSLPISSPKISAGLWLVDSHCSDDLFANDLSDVKA